MVRAALTSQLELIELNEIKEFHGILKMSAAKRNAIRTEPGASGIYGPKIYEPQQGT